MNQSSNAAPANIENKLGSFVGRKAILNDIINDIQNIKRRIIRIWGDKGIGKTRLLQEIVKQSTQQNLVVDGVYFFDIEGISSVQEVEVKMGNANLFHILKQSEKENVKRQILLIYDNADAFCKSGSQFRIHLRYMTKCIQNAKFIFTTNT